LALLWSIVAYLHRQGGPVSVEEAANHFDISERDMRQAVMQLTTSGRPGETGTYQDLDLYDIDWDALDDGEIIVTRFVALEHPPELSPLEAASLIGGLHALRHVPGLTEPDQLDRLIAKLGRGAAAPIAVEAAPAGESLPVLRDAIERGRRVTFSYRSRTSGDAQRIVDPIRLEAVDDVWYLRGWCLDRDDDRLFRLDRMLHARMLDIAAQSHHAAEPGDSLFTPSGEEPIVTLDVAPEALPLVREYLDDRDRALSVGADGRSLVEVHAGSWEHFARLACANAGRIRVVAPDAARRAVAEWARAGLDDG
ncbi:MAG: helix-turn-helix transcriptional regulator, partial [Pseudoclavibacter sp.]